LQQKCNSHPATKAGYKLTSTREVAIILVIALILCAVFGYWATHRLTPEYARDAQLSAATQYHKSTQIIKKSASTSISAPNLSNEFALDLTTQLAKSPSP
jgi:hypothetical protein